MITITSSITPNEFRTIICCVSCDRCFPLKLMPRHFCQAKHTAFIKSLAIDDKLFKSVLEPTKIFSSVIEVVYYYAHINLKINKVVRSSEVAWIPEWAARIYNSTLLTNSDKNILLPTLSQNKEFREIVDSALLVSSEQDWPIIIKDIIHELVNNKNIFNIIDLFSD